MFRRKWEVVCTSPIYSNKPQGVGENLFYSKKSADSWCKLVSGWNVLSGGYLLGIKWFVRKREIT